MKDLVLKKIDELNDEFVRMWVDVCNIESPVSDKAGVDAVGEFFKRFAEERGWKIEVFPQERAGDVVSITMNPEVDAAPIAYSGHMDTVHPIGSFGYPPTRIEGDKIYGPGVDDCKGGIVVGFLAMEALRQVGYRNRPITMYLQSDEEGGGKYSDDATIDHICEVAQGCRVFFNLEGGSHESVCMGRKGVGRFEFTVEGVEAHTAACATMGSNAILEAAHKIIELEKFKDPKGLTCCCALIKGGQTHNIVPGECVFTANVRFYTKAQLDEFVKRAEEICADVKVPGCKCTMKLARLRPAMEDSAERDELLEQMNAAWREMGFTELKGAKSAGGSDAANISAVGILTVDSMGVIGGKLHTLDEYAYVSSLADKAKRLALASLCL